MPPAGHVAWPYYLSKFNEVIERFNFKTILKTDCNNEANGNPKQGGLVKNLNNKEQLNIHILEYELPVIRKALNQFPDLKILQGDIRDLIYKDNCFDLVADFSTIDHIPEKDVYTALKEYLRVTKENGFIILVCWYAYNKKDVIGNFDKWNPGDQYFLWEDDILSFFRLSSAKVIETETIVNINYNYDSQRPWESVDIKANPKYYLKYMLIKK